MTTAPAATDSDKLRFVADEVLAGRHSDRIPLHIASLPLARRTTLRSALYELAADVEAESEPVEVELVPPARSKYTVQESRDVLYLLRVAVG
jgi:hypothetical protein